MTPTTPQNNLNLSFGNMDLSENMPPEDLKLLLDQKLNALSQNGPIHCEISLSGTTAKNTLSVAGKQVIHKSGESSKPIHSLSVDLFNITAQTTNKSAFPPKAHFNDLKVMPWEHRRNCPVSSVSSDGSLDRTNKIISVTNASLFWLKDGGATLEIDNKGQKNLCIQDGIISGLAKEAVVKVISVKITFEDSTIDLRSKYTQPYFQWGQPTRDVWELLLDRLTQAPLPEIKKIASDPDSSDKLGSEHPLDQPQQCPSLSPLTQIFPQNSQNQTTETTAQKLIHTAADATPIGIKTFNERFQGRFSIERDPNYYSAIYALKDNSNKVLAELFMYDGALKQTGSSALTHSNFAKDYPDLVTLVISDTL